MYWATSVYPEGQEKVWADALTTTSNGRAQSASESLQTTGGICIVLAVSRGNLGRTIGTGL